MAAATGLIAGTARRTSNLIGHRDNPAALQSAGKVYSKARNAPANRAALRKNEAIGSYTAIGNPLQTHPAVEHKLSSAR